jgi:sensor histidine kinase YesM
MSGAISSERRSSSISPQKVFWQLQIGGWLALMPPFIVMSLLATSTPRAAVFLGVFRQVVGFFLTLGISFVYRRWDWATFSLRRHGSLALLLSLAAAAIDLAVTYLVRDTVQFQLANLPPAALQIASSLGRSCVYVGWSAVYLALHFFFDLRDRDLRLAEAELSARDAELQSLRAQLNPHFLFNALNSILAEADDNPARVKAITLSLSDLLRFSLRQRDHFGRLGDEIAAIENYLKVERARFEERLDWQLAASPATRDAMVPASLLLPLVENAIKYGLQTSPRHLQIRIGAGWSDGAVTAFVENSGRWIEPDPTCTRSTGIGLNNLRRRLALLCGPESRVDISFPDGLVRVDLHVPIGERLA